MNKGRDDEPLPKGMSKLSLKFVVINCIFCIMVWTGVILWKKIRMKNYGRSISWIVQ